MYHSHLYFSFNTLFMSQWIKIQPLFWEINNTQNIQCILQCFKVNPQDFCSCTLTNVPTTAASQIINKRKKPEALLQSQMLPHLIYFHMEFLEWTNELVESIWMHPRLSCVHWYDGVSPHTSRGRNNSNPARWRRFPFTPTSCCTLRGL